jgi:hypothetical protein
VDPEECHRLETSWALGFDIVDVGIVEKESRYLITGRFPEQPDRNAGQSLQASYNTTNTSRFLSMPGKPALRLQIDANGHELIGRFKRSSHRLNLGAKRRALKKLLSPNHTPTAADGAPISVDSANAAPPASLPDEAVAAASNPDSYVSPGEENNIIETMQAREGAIGKATSPVSSPPPDKTKPIAVTADQLAGGTAGGGKKKSSKQRFLEREVGGCQLGRCLERLLIHDFLSYSPP